MIEYYEVRDILLSLGIPSEVQDGFLDGLFAPEEVTLEDVPPDLRDYWQGVIMGLKARDRIRSRSKKEG